MKQFGNVTYLICLLLLLVTGILGSQSVVLAAGETGSVLRISQAQLSPPTEKIELNCKYPRLEAAAGTPGGPGFSFDVDLSYTGGKEPRVFDLEVQVPPQFTFSVSTTTEPGTNILAIRLDPKVTWPQTIKLSISPDKWLMLEPGEYPVTFTVSSGELKEHLELTATVTEKYELSIDTPHGQLSTNATAGRGNNLTIILSNNSTAELEKVKLSSSASGRPSGWEVTFDPEEVKSLPVGSSREIVVTIKPDAKTIAGNYLVRLEAEAEAGTASQRISDSLEVRVTALSPAKWGWVGVGIIILIIVGLAVMFKQLGRR